MCGWLLGSPGSFDLCTCMLACPHPLPTLACSVLYISPTHPPACHIPATLPHHTYTTILACIAFYLLPAFFPTTLASHPSLPSLALPPLPTTHQPSCLPYHCLPATLPTMPILFPPYHPSLLTNIPYILLPHFLLPNTCYLLSLPPTYAYLTPPTIPYPYPYLPQQLLLHLIFIRLFPFKTSWTVGC